MRIVWVFSLALLGLYPQPVLTQTELLPRKAMLVGTTHAASQEVGLMVLKSGGTAADAAVATAMTQVCLSAGSTVSFAGIMNVVYYDAGTNRTYNMNASYDTVEAETQPESIPKSDIGKGVMNYEYTLASGRTVLVPGFMKGAESLHKKFGKLPLDVVVSPAIQCAEEGFEWSRTLKNLFEYRKTILIRDPKTKALFTKPDNTEYEIGEMYRQPDLAETLRQFVKEGSDYFYLGAWATALVEKVSALGGKLSMRDLSTYEVFWNEPLISTYRNHELRLHGTSGGSDLAFSLNMAEAAGLSTEGRFDENATVLYWLSQIARIAPLVRVYGDRIAGPLGIEKLRQQRLKKETADKLWPLLETGRFPTVSAPRTPPAHSDGIVAFDQWGNAIAMVHTINTTFWGTNGISVGGIPIPDSAAVQPRTMIATHPGERLPDTTTLGLVMDGGRPSMGFAAIGAGSTVRTLTSLVTVFDYGLKPHEVISLPALGYFTQETQPITLDELREDVRREAISMGLKLVNDPGLVGYWIGVQVDDAGMHGGSLRLQGEQNGAVVGY